MFPPHAWSLYIKIFGVVILIAACVTLGLSFWHGTVNWLSIVVSIVYLCLGAMGTQNIFSFGSNQPLTALTVHFGLHEGVYSGWKQSHFSAVLVCILTASLDMSS